jgi:hypothetical protein
MARSTPEKAEVKANGIEAPPSGRDIAGLWVKTDIGDPLTEVRHHVIPIGKPKDFFRTHPSVEYRRRHDLFVYESENTIQKEYYLLGPEMQGRIEEARPHVLVTVVDRLGMPRIWPLTSPRDGERDNAAWETARAGAREGLTQWTRLIWRGRAWTSRTADPGYAPDPDFSKLPSFDELIQTAFGPHGIIWDETHPVYRELMGVACRPDGDGDDPLE